RGAGANQWDRRAPAGAGAAGPAELLAHPAAGAPGARRRPLRRSARRSAHRGRARVRARRAAHSGRQGSPLPRVRQSRRQRARCHAARRPAHRARPGHDVHDRPAARRRAAHRARGFPMTSEGGAVSPRDPSAGLEEALADVASLRRHASSVAHDFNNLLSVITGYTEMMLRRLRPDDPLRRNAEAIKRATEWGAALAQQILAGSRRPPPAPTPVDLNQLVGNVTRVLQPLLGDNIELLTRLDSGLGRVSANPHQIGQVIMNLVVNARDAMPGGGRLTIETANVGQVVMLAVSDTGFGMDDETRARLFEPYFTTKEPGR